MKPRERAGRKETLVTVETKHCIHGGFQVEFEEVVKMTFSFGPSGINANRTNMTNKQNKHPMAGDHGAKPKQEPNSEAEPSGRLSFSFSVFPTTFLSIHPSVHFHHTSSNSTHKHTKKKDRGLVLATRWILEGIFGSWYGAY